MSDKGSNFELEVLIEEYLEYLTIERQVSPYTVRNYRFYLAAFVKWLKDHYPTIKATEITPKILKTYRVYLARTKTADGQYLAPVTQGYYVIALRSMLKYLIRQDYDVVSPERLELPRGKGHSLKFLDFDAVSRMIEAADMTTVKGLRDRAIMETLFSTGLRVSELVSLNKATVNLDTKEFGVMGKGRKVRVVFLSPRAAHWIEKYLRERDDHYQPIFISHGGRKPALDDPKAGEKMRLTTRTVQRIIRKYGLLAHLPFEVTPHVMRHSFATDLLSHGAGLRDVQEMLGHKNIATTQIYTHVTNPQLKNVHEKFHSGNEVDDT
jgi:site-specific recombinase XerD